MTFLIKAVALPPRLKKLEWTLRDVAGNPSQRRVMTVTVTVTVVMATATQTDDDHT